MNICKIVFALLAGRCRHLRDWKVLFRADAQMDTIESDEAKGARRRKSLVVGSVLALRRDENV